MVGTCGAAWGSLFVPRKFQLYTTISLYRGKVSSSAEDLGWWYLNPRESYTAVCRRNFPMQGDVAPMAGVGSKTFMNQNNRGRTLFAHPRLDFLFYSVKILEFLKSRLDNDSDERDVRRATDALLRRGHSYQEIRKALRLYTEDADFQEDY